MPLVAGVDSSPTATKVEVRDLDSGKVVGRGSSPHPPTHPPCAEQDPDAWWAAFGTAWAEAGSATALAQMVQLVRQRSLFTSSNGDRSLDTNT